MTDTVKPSPVKPNPLIELPSILIMMAVLFYLT